MRSYEDWHVLLPQDIVGRAYRSNGGELTWAARNAIAGVTTLRENGCDPLGMEIWLATRRSGASARNKP